MDQTLARLQRWYFCQCNGDWEHNAGIQIASLDNPGWLVRINLVGTALADQEFASVSVGMEKRADGLAHPSASEWHSLSIKDETFEGAGDAGKLEFILQSFLNWAERPD